MAHETLKSLIRQYINTNGQEAITGQILQDVLIEMVNEYPIVDTYLPLAGGTMTGEIKSGDLLTGSYSLSNTGIGFSYSSTGNTRYTQSIFISSVNQVISFATRGGQSQGTLISASSVTSGSFIKAGGTSDQFLKADGSVDGNNYLPLTGGTMNGNLIFTLGNVVSIPISEGTRRGNTLNIGLFDVEGTNYTWVYRSWPSNTVLAGLDVSGYMVSAGYKTLNGTSAQFLKADGSVDNNAYITSASLSGYATQTWVGQNYLPLTGGTITGTLNVSPSAGSDKIIEINGISIILDNSSNTTTINANSVTSPAFIQTSDLRKKNVVDDVVLSLKDIAEAPLIRFTWKEGKDDAQHIGTSAQYWKGITPELVHEGKDTMLSMQYDVIALAAAITTARETENLQQRIVRIENTLNIN